MLSASIRYHFSKSDIKLISKASWLHLPAIRSQSQRLELIARGCGFKSWAALSSKLSAEDGKEFSFRLELPAAILFANEKGIPFDARGLHNCLAAAALAKTAMNDSSLYPEGYGVHSCLLTREEKATLRASVLPKDFSRESWRLQQEKFDSSRSRFLDMKEVGGFLRALAFCSTLTKIKSFNKKFGSYRLKHRAEERDFLLDDKVKLSSDYVANGEFIAAAAYSGFSLNHIVTSLGEVTPNCYFNISQRSLVEVMTRQSKAA